jgi:hypothetical protein
MKREKEILNKFMNKDYLGVRETSKDRIIRTMKTDNEKEVQAFSIGLIIGVLITTFAVIIIKSI